MQLTVVMVEPETPGNIGAVARVMANFGMEKLVLVKPQCKINEDARRRAKHAQSILKNASVRDWKWLKRFDYVVGTAGKESTDYNLPRTPLTPAQLADRVLRLKKTKIALLIGREGNGLYNEELQQCDFAVTIPTSVRYPSMNVSHALTVILYELFRQSSKDKITDAYTPIDAADKTRLVKLAHEALERMDFLTETKLATQKMVWQRLIGKTFLTKREAYALMGFFRKIRH